MDCLVYKTEVTSRVETTTPQKMYTFISKLTYFLRFTYD